MNDIEERFDQYIKDELNKAAEEYKQKISDKDEKTEIKKEWLVDRAEAMLSEIEDELLRLWIEIAKNKKTVEKMEKEFRDSEEDFVIAATDSGQLGDKEIQMQLDDLRVEHDKDPYYLILKKQIEDAELRVTALKQDRAIYSFFLTNNR